MNYSIMKFGGTSMGSADSVRNVIDIIKSKSDAQKKLIVVSAMSGVTDKLLALAKKATKGESCTEDVAILIDRHQQLFLEFNQDKPKRCAIIEKTGQKLAEILSNSAWINEIEEVALLDVVSSFGEILSSITLSKILEQTMPSNFVDTRTLFVTDENFGNAKVDFMRSSKQVNEFYKNAPTGVYVNTGFIARSKNGRTTTLGRGGSDYTAGLLGNFLNTEAVQIWTDVEGVFSTDPRILETAKVLPSLSFSEAYEIAYYGGKVLHPKTMDACSPKKIAIEIRNTFKPMLTGTRVSAKKTPGIKAVSIARNIKIIEVVFGGITSEVGLLSEIFQYISSERISMDVITTSGDSISFSCDKLPSGQVIAVIEKNIGPVRIFDQKELVAVIGTDIVKQPNFQPILQIISKFSPNILSMNTKHTNLTAVVDQNRGDALVAQIHELIE